MTSSERESSLLSLSLETAPNYMSLAYRELTEIPREMTPGLESVEILDLSHNKISYPSSVPCSIRRYQSDTNFTHTTMLHPVYLTVVLIIKYFFRLSYHY